MTIAMTVFFVVTFFLFLYLTIIWSSRGVNAIFKMTYIVLCAGSFYFVAVLNNWPLFPKV